MTATPLTRGAPIPPPAFERIVRECERGARNVTGLGRAGHYRVTE